MLDEQVKAAFAEPKKKVRRKAQGYRARFIPRFPDKYVGDVQCIFARSRWEVRAMKWLDSRDQVKKWFSEEISIPYISPKDNCVHQYFPDFVALIEDNDGVMKKYLLEVKPKHEAREKDAKDDRAKDRLLVNNAKWRAAQIFCELNDMVFLVLTEESLFHQVPKKKRVRKNGKL